MEFADSAIRAALDELPPLPTDVSDWLVQTGTDSADEPAVWIWAVLRDDGADFDTLIAVRDVVLAHVREQCEVPLGVYVSFRSVSEVDDLE